MNNTKSTLDDIMSKAQADAIRLKQYFPFRICWFCCKSHSWNTKQMQQQLEQKLMLLAKKAGMYL